MNYRDYLETPIGLLEVTASANGVTSVYFVERAEVAARPNAITDQTVSQLSEYFEGERTLFDVPIDPSGTDFQEAVWSELCKIDFGKTCSYQDIAAGLNNPKAVRAVGAANGKNPISIIVPCHRVIGSNGTLTGYAGGIDRKAWLLKHEGVMLF